MDVVERTPLEQRHLAVHAAHCVGLNQADRAAWDAGGHAMLRDVTMSGTRDEIRAKLAEKLSADGVTSSPELAETFGASRAFWFHNATLVVVLVILVVMIWKPGASISRSRNDPLVTQPRHPRPLWTLLFTSPQKAPKPGVSSRSSIR